LSLRPSLPGIIRFLLRRFPEAATEKQGFGSSGKSAASMAAYFSDDPARILIRSFGKSAVQRLNAPIRHFTGWG
jgi:hypothetical protein